MQDSFGRKIDYLRLSVTEACNFQCKYCVSSCNRESTNFPPLSFSEYAAIVRAAAACGIRKLRLTGGEPLMRKNLPELCQMLSAIPGIEELSITTNGSLLPDCAKQLKESGVSRLNISLDTLDETKFRRITKTGSLGDTLAGIRAAQSAGFQDLKINTVLIGGFNDDEIGDFIGMTKDSGISVRFIELMPMHTCASWPSSCYLSAQTVPDRFPQLQKIGFRGVAEEYHMPGHLGTVGLIRPMSHSFCRFCNRIRITADGNLKPCLHSSEEIPLRGLTGRDLEAAICAAICAKPASHHMAPGAPSKAVRAMHQIGG